MLTRSPAGFGLARWRAPASAWAMAARAASTFGDATLTTPAASASAFALRSTAAIGGRGLGAGVGAGAGALSPPPPMARSIAFRTKAENVTPSAPAAASTRAQNSAAARTDFATPAMSYTLALSYRSRAVIQPKTPPVIQPDAFPKIGRNSSRARRLPLRHNAFAAVAVRVVAGRRRAMVEGAGGGGGRVLGEGGRVGARRTLTNHRHAGQFARSIVTGSRARLRST